MVGGLEQLPPDVLAWDVVAGQVAGLVQQLRTEGVEYGLTREHGAEAPRVGMKVEGMAGAVVLEVPFAGRVRTEGCGSEGERHAQHVTQLRMQLPARAMAPPLLMAASGWRGKEIPRGLGQSG